jgi:hypothetical protein
MRTTWLIDRRTCLKGLGVSLALPLLETMGWADPPRSAARPPLRIGFMFMPHGVNMDEFWPSDPRSYPATLPKTLEPLRGVIDQILLVDGISGVPRGPLGAAPHALELSTWLTATLPDVNKRDTINIAPSVDQIAAQKIGAYTALPSLELATMPQTHKENQAGLNENYYSHCSFSSPTQPVPAETSPAAVFKRLYSSRQSRPLRQGSPMADRAAVAGAPAGDADSLDRSMLDRVLAGAKSLRLGLSEDDQRKLDEYLDGVRALESRVAAIEAQQAEAARARAAPAKGGAKGYATAEPIEVVIPSGTPKLSEYMRVMGDLMVLAFQTDITRIATFITSTPNGLSYPELGFTDNHHALSHHGKDPDKLAKVAQIDRFNISQYAYIVGRMKGLREGAGTLLDNCLFMWGSGLEDGMVHSFRRLPVIISGRGAGTVRSGRHVAVNGNLGDLLGAILARTGVAVDKPIGIGTRILGELS